MEWRITQLQSDVYRLRADVEHLKNALWSLECRRREAAQNRAYLAAYLVVTAVLYGALAHGFGWI